MQIIHLKYRKHWAVISTIGCSNNTMKYYDSIFKDISIDAGKTIISLLKPIYAGSINAQIMDVSS